MYEHARHLRPVGQRELGGCGRTESGWAPIQAIEDTGLQKLWRRIELAFNAPTEAGEIAIRLWSNLPEGVGAGQIAMLYRMRWHIEGMFQRPESVLNGEVCSLRHPRAALLGFAMTVLAYSVLALLQHCVE